MIGFPNAKINIGLSIINKREDGFHNIESCLYPIPLCDVLEIRPSNKFSIKIYGDYDIPMEDNLIYKTWKLLVTKFSKVQPVEVLLYKNIPPGSGLGGGSSDAACFLKMINSFFLLKLTINDLELISDEIGSDCTFFIKNIPVIVTGKGNITRMVDLNLKGKQLILVFPKIPISTKKAFSEISIKTSLGLQSKLKLPVEKWKNLINNDFESWAFQYYPILQDIKTRLFIAGASYSSMTGSGSAIYSVSDNKIDSEQFKNLGYRAWNFELKNNF